MMLKKLKMRGKSVNLKLINVVIKRRQMIKKKKKLEFVHANKV